MVPLEKKYMLEESFRLLCSEEEAPTLGEPPPFQGIIAEELVMAPMPSSPGESRFR